MKIVMKQRSAHFNILKISVSVGLMTSLLAPIALVSPWDNAIAQAQGKSSRKAKFRMPPIPKGDPPGGLSGGGGGRSDCPAVKQPLTVLMPTTVRRTATGRTIKDVWSLTTTSAPSLWFYSPYASGDRYPVELIIRENNANGKILAKRSVSMPPKPGVFQVTMPDGLVAMRENERRYWQLNLICSLKPTARPPVPIQLAGMIQRVELLPSDLKALEAAETPHDLAVEYADRGLWLDAIGVLGNGRITEPENPVLKEDWKDLLESAGLSAFVRD
jgi:Domain of Unknown Function (DUF928)